VRRGSVSHRDHLWSLVTIDVRPVVRLASQRVTAPGEPFGCEEKTKSEEPDHSYNPTSSIATRKESERDGQRHQSRDYRGWVRKMSTLSIRGTTGSGRLVGAGISLIVIVGLIHLINSPEDLEEGAYTGLLYLANFFGAILAAIGIYRGRSWGWSLGALVSVGAFAGYVISRTVGLPGLGVEEEWLEPLGVLSLLVEALFVGLFLTVIVRPTGGSGMHGKAHPS
jgi:hypothetical protein